MMQNILIICIGNICRSPMAEALLRHKLKEANFDISVESAGLAALVGHQADPLAQKLMLERDIDISSHRARQVTYDQLATAELILTMSTRQKEQIKSKLPTTCGKVHCLGKWENLDIADPYKGTIKDFESALQLIEQGIESWFLKLWQKH